MMGRFCRWIALRQKLEVVLLLFVTLILLNIVAYKHAYAMLNFTQAGERTASPEALSLWQKIKTLLMGIHIPKPRNNSTPSREDLSFEVHQIKVKEDIDLEAWRISRPRSKGIVLMFHGYASSKSRLLPEAKAFHELGYAPFLVDFRGSGGSSGYKTSIGFAEADDVASAVAYVRLISPNQSTILYGQSMGGVAILRAISTHNIQPDALILEAVFDRMLSTVQNRFAAMGLPSFPAAQLLVFWGGVQSGYSGFKHNPSEYATRVQCPTLMLHGTDDPRATLAEGRAVFQNLRGVKQFEAFAGVGHESYLAAHPDQWKHSVSEFLAQVI